MQLVSTETVAFVAVSVAIYHSLPDRAQLPWLLIASYVFYSLCAPRFLPALLLCTALTVVSAERIRAGHDRRAWLALCVGANLALLVWLRIAYGASPFTGPIAAMGAAFYTLQAISLVADTHSGKLRVGTWKDVALYLSYFPKIVAGPIERAHAFVPRLGQRAVVTNAVAARAATLIVVGLTRKLVIADPLMAALPPAAFSEPEQLGGADLAMTIAGYGFALYNDFAGYTNVVCGVSLLFGIELSPNFAQPFFARSFADFWNRWHMSFSYWLRDYLFTPLSRALMRRTPSLKSPVNLGVPPLVTMLASGVWHGSGLHMAVWGALHGIFLAVERIAGVWWPRRGRPQSAARRIAGTVVVFALGCAALVFFRLPLDVAFRFWSRLLSDVGTPHVDAGAALCVTASLLLDGVQSRHGDDAAFLAWPRPARAALLATAVTLWVLLAPVASRAPFVYQGF